jgi:hypothetical protein
MTGERPVVTNEDVLTFVLAGCSAREIADYAGIRICAAVAWIGHVLHGYQRSAA